MRKIIIGLVAVFVVLLAAALIGPSFVDWNKYKPEIVARVKTATGRDMTIGGDIGLSILPVPTLSVHDVTLANLPGAHDPNMASLKSLDVRVGLGALLEGKIRVERIALVNPTISLEVMKDGRNNWTFAPAGAAPEKPAGAETAPEREAAPGGKAGGGMGAIEVGNFRIENGTLIYRDDAAGTVQRVEKLNLDFSAPSLSGPFRADGDMVARGMKLAFSGEVGNIGGKDIPLRLEAELPDADAKVGFHGTLSAPTVEGKVTGRIEASGDDLARLVGVVTQAGGKGSYPAPLSRKFSAAADLTGSAKAVSLNDLKIALGDTLASGAVDVVPGTPLRVDLTLAMTSLELDPWIAAGESKAPPPSKSDAKSGDKGGGGKEVAAPESAGFSLPANIAANVDVSIDAVVYKRDLIRKVTLRAALENGRLAIKQASASLPGGSGVTLSGTLASAAGKPSFDGAVQLVSDNLRSLFDWLKIDISKIPQDRLRKFSFDSRIKGTPAQVDLTGVDIKLDTSEIKGGVSIALRERPAFGARVDVDSFNVDAYLPPAPSAAAPAAAEKTEAKPAPAPAPAAAGNMPALAVLSKFDANIQAKIGSLTLHGMQFGGVAFDGTLQNGALTVRDASVADLGGGSAKVTGVLSGLAGKPTVDGAFDIRIEDPARMMRLANKEPPPPVTRLGPVVFAGSAKGALDAFSFGAALDAAGGRITAQGTAGMPEGGPRYDVALTAKSADLPALIRVYNPEYRPSDAKLGGLDLSLRAQGDSKAAEISDLKGNVGPVALNGSARAKFDGPRPAFDANIQAGDIVADQFLPPKPEAAGAAPEGGKPAKNAPTPLRAGEHWSKEPFDFAPLKAADAEVKLAANSLTYNKYRVDKPELQISLRNGVLNVPALKGTMFGGAFDMKGALDATAMPKLSGDVTISKADIHEALFQAGNINVAQGKLDYAMKVAGAGASPFAMVSSLSGNGSMQVLDGTLKGFDLKAVSDRLNNINSWIDFLKFLGTSMSGGETKFSKLGGTFTIDKGIVRTDDMSMVADAATGKGAGTIDLPGWKIDMNADFTLTQHPDIPSFGMRIVGPLDAPERKFDTKKLEALGIQKGVGTLLKKVLPGKEKEGEQGKGTTQEKPLDTLLKKVLPGQESTQPAQPAQPTQPAPQQQQQPAQQQPAQQQPAPAQPVNPLEKLFKKIAPKTETQPAPAQPAPPPTAQP